MYYWPFPDIAKKTRMLSIDLVLWKSLYLQKNELCRYSTGTTVTYVGPETYQASHPRLPLFHNENTCLPVSAATAEERLHGYNMNYVTHWTQPFVL